jgi:hypothetical protein
MSQPLGTNPGAAHGVVDRLLGVLNHITEHLNTFETAAQNHIAGWEGNSYQEYVTAKTEWDAMMADAYAKLNRVPPLVGDMSQIITDADGRGSAIFQQR